MKKLILVVFYSVIYLGVSAQVFEVENIFYSGDPEEHINLVILGDGYTEDELPKLVEDASNFTTEFFEATPFKEYKEYFNIYLIKSISNESGATHPGTATDVTEPASPVQNIDNIFGSSFDRFDIHRLLVPTETGVLFSVLFQNFPLYDQVVILVNSPTYGGSGGQFATTSTHASSAEIAIHELGHSFGNLKDEYYAGDVFATEAANMTQETDPVSVIWKNWIDYGGVNVYQHCCSGESSSWYRPHQSCKMRQLGADFCPVCIETMVEVIHELVDPVSSYYPEELLTDFEGQAITFGVETIQPNPNTLKRTWSMNGEIIETNVDQIDVDFDNLDIGINQLQLAVQDTSDFLRSAYHDTKHIYTYSWTIENQPTATNELSVIEDEVSLFAYPNPAKDRITVKLESNHERNFLYELVDALGSRIKVGNLTSGVELFIEVNDLASGVYFLNVSSMGNLVINKKIVIEK